MIGFWRKKLKVSSGKLIFFAFFLPLTSFSSEPEKFPGARAAGLGNTTIALTDSWSMFNNQAGLGLQRNYWAGVYHENRYFIKELSYSSMGICIPVKPGTFGVGLTHFGYSQFNQTRFSLSYGMRLSKTVAAGIGLNYHTLQIANGYGSTSCISAEGGIIYQPISKITIGAYAFNPTNSKLGDDKNLSTTFGIGLAYQPADKVLIVIQGDDNTLSDPVFRAGVEYAPVKNLYTRIGISSNPMMFSFGLGWLVKSISFDLAFSYHEVLGYTPYVSVAYTFGGKAKKTEKAEQ